MCLRIDEDEDEIMKYAYVCVENSIGRCFATHRLMRSDVNKIESHQRYVIFFLSILFHFIDVKNGKIMIQYSFGKIK